MKTIAFILLVAASGYAQTAPAATPAAQPVKPKGTTLPQPKGLITPTKKWTPVTPAAASQKPKPTGTTVTVLPAGATLVEPNVYRSVDSSGKVWMYRQTPFGFSKWEDTPNAAPLASAPEASDLVTVKDMGDRVRFERKTPFGATQWVRKKSELSDDEKALVAREQEKNPSSPNGPASAPAPAAEKP